MAQQNLRDRAASAAGNGVQRRPTGGLREQIKLMETQFQLAMPKGMEAKQLVRDAMTVLQQNPGLAGCDSKSVLGALMTCSQLGLRPGVLGQAYVIPFKGRAQLIVGYQGLLALAHRSGDIASIEARKVHEHDHFDYQFGLHSDLTHKPAMSERGPAIAYYCIVKTKAGGVLWDVMSRADAETHRDKFAMARKGDKVVGPWVEHFDAMALKTVIIRVLKLVPRSTEIVTAMAADESFRVDLTPTADPADVSTSGDEDVMDGEVIDDEPDPESVDTDTGEISEPPEQTTETPAGTPGPETTP